MTTRAIFYDSSQINDRLSAFLGGIAYGGDAGFYNTEGLDTAGIDTLIATISATSQQSVFAVANIGTNPPSGNLTAGQVTTLDGKLSTSPGADAATREIQNVTTASVLQNLWKKKNLNMWDSVYPSVDIAGNYPLLFHFTGTFQLYVVLGTSTATSGTASALTDTTQNFNTDTLAGRYLAITAGTGIGEIRKIQSNTATVITPETPFVATLDNTSVYEIRGYVDETRYAIGEPPSIGLTATSGTNSTIVRTGSGWTTNQFANMSVRIISGTGAGQERLIKSNTATALTVVKNWSTNPDNTSVFQVVYYLYKNSDVIPVLPTSGGVLATTFSGTTIGSSTLTLATNRYAGFIVEIISGTGTGQRMNIASNNGTTLTTTNSFATTPDGTSVFRIVRTGGDWGFTSKLDGTFIPYDLADYYIPLAFNVYFNDATDTGQQGLIQQMLGLQNQQTAINSGKFQNIEMLNEYIERGRTIYLSNL